MPEYIHTEQQTKCLLTAANTGWCKIARISTFWDTEGEEEVEEEKEEEKRKQKPVLTNISPYGKYLINWRKWKMFNEG